MDRTPTPQGEILLYENGGEKEFVSVVFQDETFWLTQSGMAELFDCSTDNISLHLKNIYAEEELTPEATTEKISVVRQEGSRQVRRTSGPLQPGRHYCRGLPGELQEGHPVPPVGHQNAEGVHPEGLRPQRRDAEKRPALR